DNRKVRRQRGTAAGFADSRACPPAIPLAQILRRTHRPPRRCARTNQNRIRCPECFFQGIRAHTLPRSPLPECPAHRDIRREHRCSPGASPPPYQRSPCPRSTGADPFPIVDGPCKFPARSRRHSRSHISASQYLSEQSSTSCPPEIPRRHAREAPTSSLHQ